MEPPSFHLNNLHNNKINWNKKKIENLLYKLLEEKYPNNNLFIKNIANTINVISEYKKIIKTNI